LTVSGVLRDDVAVDPEAAAMRRVHEAWSRRLVVLGLLAVGYGALCKVLLFRDFEYLGSDLYSFLDMSWSWLFTGRLLHENAYGNHAAIHNFYLLLAFSPLTVAFGAYGLFLGLGVLSALSTVRVATSRSLDPRARIAVLAGSLSPLAFYVLDDPDWGFHPELCYPPLAVLLALELRERRFRRALLWAVATVLVKEDGAVVCGSVLAAYFAERLWQLRKGPSDERRRTTFAAAATLAAVCLVFVAGLAVLWAVGRHAVGQETASGRLTRSLKIVARTVSGHAIPDRAEALTEGIVAYVVLASLVLLPLGRRWVTGLALGSVGAPPVLATLVASGALYKFAWMFWAPRLALVLALACACLVLAASAPGGPRLEGRTGVRLGALVAASWGLQLLVLHHFGYPAAERVNALALARGDGYAISTFPAAEIAFARCIAGRLPRGMTVSVTSETHPLFHRQSIVFVSLEAHASRPPRVWLLPSSTLPTSDTRFCRGPQVGELVLVSECVLLPAIASCGIRTQLDR
jgi:hypothetical protein